MCVACVDVCIYVYVCECVCICVCDVCPRVCYVFLMCVCVYICAKADHSVASDLEDESTCCKEEEESGRSTSHAPALHQLLLNISTQGSKEQNKDSCDIKETLESEGQEADRMLYQDKKQEQKAFLSPDD